jgi:predicted dehydrogenase
MDKIGWGIIGYGGQFSMGHEHAMYMSATGRMKPVAFCEIDPKRLEQAKKDYPDAAHYDSFAALLKNPEVKGVTIITPHSSHYELARTALESGRHVVVEKPICITTQQVDDLIAIAKKGGKIISAYHNRRWDADILAIRSLIKKGTIGEPFHVNIHLGNYAHPGKTWRSDKGISGGCFYDWGVHLIDYALHIITEPIDSVMGFFFKSVWDVTNEDHTEAVIRFKGGQFANVSVSTIDAAAARDKFRILGTKGAIQGGWDLLKVHLPQDGFVATGEIRLGKPEHHKFYENIAAHILDGAALVVTPESARRNIAVIEAAEKSAKLGAPVKPAHE